MKFAFIALAGCLLFIAALKKEPAPPRHIATCYGYTPCKACSDCSLCRHCNNGGTCGKCKDGKPAAKSKTPASSGQCQATTQKGTRCKRNAKSSGYCWQHE